MADNHNCILLDSECEDICRVVEKTRLPLLTRHISGDLVVMCALEAMSGTASSSERAKFTERLLERLHHSEFEASRAAEQNTKKPTMQLKKQNWKKIRNTTPCVKCGENHPSKMCITRNGKKKERYE